MLTKIPMFRRFAAFLAATVLIGLPAVLPAQTLEFGGFQLGDSISLGSQAETKVSATLHPGGQPGSVRLDVKVELPPGANTYSQNPGPTKATRIVLDGHKLEPLDPAFTPDRPPKKVYEEIYKADVEKFFEQVTFSRTFRLPPGTEPATLDVRGKVDLLVCDATSCAPKRLEFVARWASKRAAPSAAAAEKPSSVDASSTLETGYVIAPLRGKGENAKPDPLKLQFELSGRQAKQGETVLLAVTMTLDAGWQTYALQPAPDQLETPTSFKFTSLENLEPAGEMYSVPDPVQHETKLGSEVKLSSAHAGRVTWLQEFRAQADGPVGIAGSITYQICEKGACLFPQRIPFSLGSVQEGVPLAAAEPVKTSFLDAAQLPAPSQTSYALQEEQKIDSLAVALPLAFLGGLILNVMPCVLPVIAIKILSFVQQAGEHRSRIFALNVAYTVGVVSVFMALAALAVVVNLGWGQQFQNTTFNVVMICIVFAMALSLLGVYEIPIPGLIPSAGSQQEGIAGAFTTGIVATILATPCTGPFMATVLSWAVTQPPATVFMIFGTMGLGMASPYVAAGLFPTLVNWLPKPGVWMVTFKQFAGFVLLGTVIFLMYSLDGKQVPATLIVLLGIGLFLWMIGSLYHAASPATVKWRIRSIALVTGVSTAALGVYLGWFHTTELPWEPFTEQRMVELREEGRPVLVDFTADWCGICKTNEAIALNTRKTAAFIKEHGVVTLVADFTKENPEIRKWLNEFGQDSVPLTVIFPKGGDRKLIPLRGAYTQGTLLDALRRAVEPELPEASNDAAMPVTSTAD